MSTPTPHTPVSASFRQFLHGLQADQRLGRYLPTPIDRQEPDAVVLALVLALADAVEGKQPHPAMDLLDRMQEAWR